MISSSSVNPNNHSKRSLTKFKLQQTIEIERYTIDIHNAQMKDIEKENVDTRKMPSVERGTGSEPAREIQVRNSTVDFLVFTRDAGDDGISVLIENDTVWLTQEGIATLFDKARTTISEHISKIYSTGELDSESTCRKFRHMGANGQEYWPTHYNLDVIISVGYRVDSIKATQFRRWATNVLRDFTIKGYVLDKERLKNGQVFSQQYFDHLLDEIREIRASERLFYQKITDIYATAYDYDPQSPITQDFFSAVQNKMHYATAKNYLSAAELSNMKTRHNVSGLCSTSS